MNEEEIDFYKKTTKKEFFYMLKILVNKNTLSGESFISYSEELREDVRKDLDI